MTKVGLQIQDRVLLGLSIDGTDLPINLSNILQLQTTESVSQRLPSFRMIYNDQSGFIHDRTSLSDGSKFGLILHSGITSDPESPQDMTFSVMGHSFVPHANSLRYRLAGTFDSVKYLRGIAKKPYNDSSSGAIGQIAKLCGLKYEGLGTSDKMPWLPASQTMNFSDFANYIGLHGRAGSKSVMSLGVTDEGIIKYKDLGKLITQSGGRRILPASSAGLRGANIPYLTFEVINVNGFANLTQGQGMEIVQEKMTGSFDILNLIESAFSGGSLNVSKAIGEALGGSVLKEFVPTDMKNVHEKFYQAKNQNMRGTSLFSSTIEVLTTQATGLHIYDTVYFEPVNPSTNKVMEKFAGNYIVSARTRYLEKKTYFEKIRIQSNNGPGGSGMQGGQ